MKRSRYFEQPVFIPTFKDYSHFLGKSIGITGKRGLLGGILSKRLSSHKIHIEAYPGDITDTMSLKAWFGKYHFDYFFHFAAIVPICQVMHNPLKAYDVNVVGSYNICKQIIETQRDCWLFLASSSHIYKGSPISGETVLTAGYSEKPDTFYGVSKLAAERISIPILEQYKISYCIGRAFSFSSVSQREPYLVPTLRRKIEEKPDNGVVEIINPDSVRNIMDADTVIDCILYLARKRFKGMVDIGSGKGMKIEDIALHIAKLLGKKIQIRGFNKDQPNSLVANVQVLKQVISEDIHL